MGGGGKGASRGRGGRGGRRPKLGAVRSSVPTCVLSFHQPLASMIAYGLQRLDGRGWCSEYRGPLWIHAASKEPSPEEISEMEAFHTSVFRSLATYSGGDPEAVPTLPSSYPTSCLLGCVNVVDCVSAETYASWLTLPDGALEEASIHGNGYYFLFEGHRRLVVPQRMPGQHKLWQLERQLATLLWESDGVRPSAQAPISWVGHREAAEAAAADAVATLRPSEPTEAMKRNARRTAVRQAAAKQHVAGGTMVESMDLQSATIGSQLGRSTSEAPSTPAPASVPPSQWTPGPSRPPWVTSGHVEVTSCPSRPPGLPNLTNLTKSCSSPGPSRPPVPPPAAHDTDPPAKLQGGHSTEAVPPLPDATTPKDARPHAQWKLVQNAQDSLRGSALAEEDPMDAWMLAQALAISVTEENAIAAARVQAMEFAPSVAAVRSGPGTGAIALEAAVFADADVDDRIFVEDECLSRIADLTRMGFERAKAVEMLTLCGGDVAQAVALLCG
jgi:hypothetical protein